MKNLARILRPLAVTALAGATLLSSAGAAVAASPTHRGDIQLSYVAVVRVAIGTGDQDFRVRITDPETLNAALDNKEGRKRTHIHGLVVRPKPDVNKGYHWHLDPASIGFVESSIEVCDGSPADVEKGAVTSDYYCPWSSRVVEVWDNSGAAVR